MMISGRLRLIGPLGILIVLAAACGAPQGADEGESRTVVIHMRDNHFEPEEIEVESGEPVRLLFINSGRNRHDAFIGDEREQEEHEQEARQSEGGHGGHQAGADNAVTVDPGTRAELSHVFSELGTTLIGCHEPGHYEGGMVVTVRVT